MFIVLYWIICVFSFSHFCLAFSLYSHVLTVRRPIFCTSDRVVLDTEFIAHLRPYSRIAK